MSADDSRFETRAARTLGAIAAILEDADDGDLDIDLDDGVLTVQHDEAGTFVINRHLPLRQVWLSSPVSGAAHYAWDAAATRWTATRGGPPLDDVLSDEFGRLTGRPLSFAAINAD